MADTLLRLTLISAAIVDAHDVVMSPQTSARQPLLPVSALINITSFVCPKSDNLKPTQISSAELIRVLHGTSASITQACGRSATAAFTALAGHAVLSRCAFSFEALSIMVDVQAFFAGDDQALEVELWGLWQVRACAFVFGACCSCDSSLLFSLTQPKQTPSSRPQSAR